MILVNEGVVAIPVFPRRPVQPILWTYFTISTDISYIVDNMLDIREIKTLSCNISSHKNIFLLLSLDLFLH